MKAVLPVLLSGKLRFTLDIKLYGNLAIKLALN